MVPSQICLRKQRYCGGGDCTVHSDSVLGSTSGSLVHWALWPGVFQLATEHLVSTYHTPDPWYPTMI